MNFKSITLALMLAMTSSAAMAIPYSPDYLQADQTESETGSMQFIPKGNFESWSSQSIKESGIIGGNTVTLMHIGRPWGSSNVWAKVSGVTKTNVSVYRDTHPGHGHCAKLYTHIVEAKVLGIINIKVLAAGSIFLGSTLQPITDTKNPMAKLNAGLRFTKRPKAIVFDYKTHIVKGNRIRQNGITRGATVAGQDMADCILYLQKRWEDARGNIYAKRVGTMCTVSAHQPIGATTNHSPYIMVISADKSFIIQHGVSPLAHLPSMHVTQRGEWSPYAR